MSRRMYQPNYSRNREGFTSPTSSQLSEWANLNGIFQDAATDMKGVACGSYPPMCSGLIQPVINSSNNVCVNTVNHLKSQICGPLATTASEPCRSSRFCPSEVTEAIQNIVLRECNSRIPDGSTVCGFVNNIGGQAINECSNNLRSMSNCEGFRRRRGY